MERLLLHFAHSVITQIFLLPIDEFQIQYGTVPREQYSTSYVWAPHHLIKNHPLPRSGSPFVDLVGRLYYYLFPKYETDAKPLIFKLDRRHKSWLENPVREFGS